MQTADRKRSLGAVLHGAARYDLFLWLMTFGRERALREKMISRAHLGSGESVLDVGCGTGTLAILAKEQVGAAGSVCGIDASPEMIARARTKAHKAGVEISFEIAPAQELPFPDGRFDVALATVMLHHLARSARAQCLREIKRVLKPNGRALVVDFEASSQHRGLLGHLHRRHGHVAEEDLHAMLGDAGFELVESGPVGFRDLHFSLAKR
jgi:ubiquinone/menaquinone biosynthesis C-methylase UbiE